jgi:DNA-binding Lrp family transcriptional regulator
LGTIYFDSDFLISFLKPANDYFYLVQAVCKGYEFIIPQEVYNELLRRRTDSITDRVDELEKRRIIKKYTMKINELAATIRYMLQNPRPKCKIMGPGEAAAIALCKANNGILASNNMRDVAQYTELQGIKHITTSRVIDRAFKLKVIEGLSKTESIWSDIISSGRRMPKNTFKEFLEMKESWPLD